MLHLEMLVRTSFLLILMLLGQDHTLLSMEQEMGLLKAALDEGESGKAMRSRIFKDFLRKKSI